MVCSIMTIGYDHGGISCFCTGVQIMSDKYKMINKYVLFTILHNIPSSKQMLLKSWIVDIILLYGMYTAKNNISPDDRILPLILNLL